MKLAKEKIITIFILLMVNIVCLNQNFVCNAATNSIKAEDLLTTKGTKIVNQKGEEVVLKGYNVGLWLSRSFWGLPIDAKYNTNDDLRHSSVNNTEIYYELFTNKNNFSYDEVIALNDAFYENYISTEDMDTLSEIGVNVVRLPFEWSFFMKPVFNDGKVSWKDDAEYFEEKLDFLERKVNEFGERGIYVILDLHVAPGGQNGGGYRTNPSFFRSKTEGLDESNQRLALKIWREIAKRFCNNPTIAGYDIINEPGGVDFQKYIVPFYNEAYKTIRSKDSNHIIIMETKFNTYKSEGNLPKPAEKGWKNVVYSTHDYFWNREDRDGDSETGEMTDKIAPEKEELKRRIKEYTNKAIELMRDYYKVPLYIGEFNHLATNTNENKTNNDEVWSYAFDIYNNNNVNYTAWTYKAGWDPYMGMVYYGRKDFTYEKNGEKHTINLGGSDGKRIDLKTASYDEIYAVFSAKSYEAMNFNKEFYDICKKNLNIIGSWDISATSEDSVQAILTSNGVLTISGKGKMSSEWTLKNTAPWYNNRQKIKEINIGYGITNIGQDAFLNCDNLKKVSLPKTLIKIEGYVFHNCKSLTNIEIPSSVTNVNMGVFYNCVELKDVEFGNGISYLGEKIFFGCDNVKITCEKGSLVEKYAKDNKISYVTKPAENINVSITANVILNQNLQIKYNGEIQRFKNVKGEIIYPISYQGTTYLPIRSISCLFKTGIEWDGDTNSIYLGSGELDTISAETISSFENGTNQTITVKVNEDIKIYYNESIKTFNDANGKTVYPLSYNGTTYLPVRAISNLYNADIKWVSETSTVVIQNG